MSIGNTIAVTRTVLTRPGYMWLFLLIWFLVLSVFTWLTRLNLLAYIFTEAQLDPLGKLLFIIQSYLNLFATALSPLPFTIIVFSFVTAVSFTLVTFLARQGSKLSGSRASGGKAVGTMVLAHILSCGTSLTIPLVTALIGAGSFIGGSRAWVYISMGVVANLLGTWLMIRESKRAASRISSLRFV